MIVGNKVDKESSGSREVSRKEGEAFARKMGTLFIEASAKTKTGVKDAFIEVVRKVFFFFFFFFLKKKKKNIIIMIILICNIIKINVKYLFNVIL